MPYFCFDKDTGQMWVTSDVNKTDLIEIQYASITLNDSYFELSPLNSEDFSIKNESDCIILNSKLVQPPCSFCKKNIRRIFSSENCKPCNFQMMEPYDKYDLPFEKKELETSLINKGYIRTSKKMFLKSLFLENQRN